MHIHKKEDGSVELRAGGTLTEEDEAVYPALKGVEDCTIQVNLSSGEAGALANLVHGQSLQVTKGERDYLSKRITLLRGKLEAVHQEASGTPSVDPENRKHEWWSPSLEKIRAIREAVVNTGLKNEELLEQLDWWVNSRYQAEESADKAFAVMSDLQDAVTELSEDAPSDDVFLERLTKSLEAGWQRRRRGLLSGDWMQTYSGRVFWPLAPHHSDVSLTDIAHGLSMQCRYNGHCNQFYSVAQHSILVSRIVPSEDAKWGLLHDAAEAYIGDLIRPIKHTPMARWFRVVEDNIMRCVCEHFGLPLKEPPSIKEADLRALGTERRDLMSKPPRPWSYVGEPHPQRIEPLGPEEAKQRFLERATVLGIE